MSFLKHDSCHEKLVMQEMVIHWFRRDFRLTDNTALYHALKSGYPVLPVFIFDTNILDELKDSSGLTKDKRVQFIYEQLRLLKQQLTKSGSDLQVYYGNPETVWHQLLKLYSFKSVFVNHDYEPYAASRDQSVRLLLQKQGVDLLSFKDQVIFEKSEVVKDDGKPYTVYTPYSKKWKSLLTDAHLASKPSEQMMSSFLHVDSVQQLLSLAEMGFESVTAEFPEKSVNTHLILHYPETRDLPAMQGTSRLSVHLRFGTISIRQLCKQAIAAKGEKFLNELIWREFYMMILHHFPNVVHQSFKPEYDKIAWRNDEREFKAWCEGKTGYPIVDAGMRELNATGFMHNRVRMVVASFLTKHLLIDWRRGEAYFASKLLDYELASNNGGWQWAAGSGVDAAPYFRVFNPYLQTLKFDAKLEYIRKWIPELDTLDYPKPLVEHDFARKRCLEVYKSALQRN
jgi:deoxyribodipyrimidine photo-lyase